MVMQLSIDYETITLRNRAVTHLKLTLIVCMRTNVDQYARDLDPLWYFVQDEYRRSMHSL